MNYLHVGNVTESTLSSNDEFLNTTRQAIKILFETTGKLVINDDKNKIYAKIFSNDDAKVNYMVVNTNDKWIVCEEKHFEGNSTPFEYTRQRLTEGSSEIYSIKLLELDQQEVKAVFLDVNKKAKLNTLLTKVTDKSDTNLDINILSQIQNMLKDITAPTFKSTHSPYALKVFFNYLENEKIIKQAPEDSFWEILSTNLVKDVDTFVTEIKMVTEFCFDMCEKHKFTENNKYFFNDSDNSLWSQNRGIVLADQSFSYYITMKGEELTVYACDRDKNNSKKHTYIGDLIHDVNTNPINFVDNVALKVVNNKTVYADNCMIENFTMNLEFGKKALINDKLGNVIYPVDITDYDYQLAYYQKNYGVTEFDFLSKAFLVVGGGFQYDKKNGNLIDNSITYDPEVLNFKAKDKPKKIEKIICCDFSGSYPTLNEKWLKGLKYLTEVLKCDKPIPMISKTDNKEKDVANTVKKIEKFIKAVESNQLQHKIKL